MEPRIVRLNTADNTGNTDDDATRARSAAASGAKVVVVAGEANAEEAGRLAAELQAAVFIGEEGLPEFLSELFGAAPSP